MNYWYGIVLLLFTPIFGFSQVNSHYWSHQYGAKGLLLNGAVVASVTDETALFYNPGALGLTHDFGISVSLLTPTYSVFKASEFLGEGTDFADKGVALSPGLVALMFRPFKSKKITIGLTSFKRFKSDINVFDRIVRPVPDNSFQMFLADVDFKRKLDETWLGVGIAYKLHDRLSVGITHFNTWRSEQVSLDFKKEILDRVDSEQVIASWRSDFRYGYSANAGALTKFGISWLPGRIKLGATFTTTTYGVLLSGADYAIDDQKIFKDQSVSLTSNARAVDLEDYYTPWSIGLGIEVPIGGSALSLSSEYFHSVERYNLIHDVDDPYNGLSSNPNLTTVTISQANKKVLNVAIGIERNIDSTYTWFYGFRTDFSPQKKLDIGNTISFLAGTPNFYHLSTGCTWDYKDSRFSIGFDYGFGSKSEGSQLVDIKNINADTLFEFKDENTVQTWVHQIALYITYDL